MTGFARREQDSPIGQLVCELRSVNHRFLEAGFRLPEELRGLESELRQRVAQLEAENAAMKLAVEQLRQQMFVMLKIGTGPTASAAPTEYRL